MASRPLAPLVGVFETINECVATQENPDTSTVTRCLHESVDVSDGPVATALCAVVDSFSLHDLQMSIPAERCEKVANTAAYPLLQKLVDRCKASGATMEFAQQLLHACHDRVNNTTNWAVVLGLAIPFGILGLIVMFTTLRVIYKMQPPPPTLNK